jgi:hypothetical protein
MKTMTVLVALFLVSTAMAQAACPFGSFPSIDSWGNRTCEDLGSGRTTTIEGGLNRCPIGTHPWIDSWGNRTCQSFGGGSQYHDTSRGCPIGTFPSIDTWGNKACERF